MKVKGFLLAGAAGAAVAPAVSSEVAQAADMLLKAPPPAPVVTSWAGWYIGATAGAAVKQASAVYGISVVSRATPTGSQTSFIGGGEIGFNFQAGNLVYGGEADISGITGTQTFGFHFDDSYTSRFSWLSTVRGRVGLAVGNTMAYVTAGLAIARVKNELIRGCSCNAYSDSSTRTGLAVGGGIAHKINRNWSLKLEGLFVDLGHKTVAWTLNSDKLTRFNNSAVIARVGLDYHF